MTEAHCCTPADSASSTPVGTSCCTMSAQEGSLPQDANAVKDLVRDKYSRIAAGDEGCGYSMIGDAYDQVDGYLDDADLGLGCGLPVEHANLQPGHAVLDLGSGAGLDAFVARRIVGEQGQVVGLDFSAPMVQKAQDNARKLAYTNVEFVLGDIEDMPLPAESFDVVVSNCVLNLVPDKDAAFREMYRVLRRGGHFAISDVVVERALPESIRQSSEAYVGCVAGALEREVYLALIRESGFQKVRVAAERSLSQAPGVLSITVQGTKP